MLTLFYDTAHDISDVQYTIENAGIQCALTCDLMTQLMMYRHAQY